MAGETICTMKWIANAASRLSTLADVYDMLYFRTHAHLFYQWKYLMSFNRSCTAQTYLNSYYWHNFMLFINAFRVVTHTDTNFPDKSIF